jgi:myo-inositol catabolism protein IolC
MTNIGFNKPLYILPFDHRGSFQKKMFGWDGALSPQQTAEIAAAKRVDAGVEPDVWKIEGLDRRDDCDKIVAAAHRGSRNEVGCIILGRGEDDKEVQEWLTTASTVPGFIGFAVGRTSFWNPLIDWRSKKITRDAAVAEISRRYQQFVGIFETSNEAVLA